MQEESLQQLAFIPIDHGSPFGATIPAPTSGTPPTFGYPSRLWNVLPGLCLVWPILFHVFVPRILSNSIHHLHPSFFISTVISFSSAVLSAVHVSSLSWRIQGSPLGIAIFLCFRKASW